MRGEKVAVIPVMSCNRVLDWWIQTGNVDNKVYERFLWACVVRLPRCGCA